MTYAEKIDFDGLMEPVARRLLGDPNATRSRPPNNVRFGTHGSMSVDCANGYWYDHENKMGGGVIDLVKHKLNCDHPAAVTWLRREGFLASTPRPTAPKPAQSSRSRSRIIDTYDYCDENGEIVFQVVRYEPKDFRQRRPDGTGGWIDEVKSLGDRRYVPYRLPEVVKAIAQGHPIWIVEGEKDVDNLAKLGIVATCNAGGASKDPEKPKWRSEHSNYLLGANAIIASDNDAAGRAHAEAIAKSLSGIAKRVRVVDLLHGWPNLKEKGDVSDCIKAGATAEQLWKLADETSDWSPSNGAQGFEGFEGTTEDRNSARERDWPESKEIPNVLAPVQSFSLEFMPEALKPWIGDIAERLQCPPDYVAVSVMTALGSIIGRRLGIAPQMHTDWVEIPNLWGCFIGRPGMLKSPAMQAALAPLWRLEAEAAEDNKIALEAYQNNLSAYAIRKTVAMTLEKNRLKKAENTSGEIKLELDREPEEPVPLRYRTNDSSYEALGELLINNPMGLLVERDELVSLLTHLDREDQANARGFYLSGWSGTTPYTFDRIVRGHRHIGAVCISVLGNTQPAKIGRYIRHANSTGGGDGLIQRFGLMVWPDICPEWRNVDKCPDPRWREQAYQTFKRLSEIDLNQAMKLGATKGQYDKIPHLRLDDASHDEFLRWRADLEKRLRDGEMSEALEGHLSKYRKAVPSLALINHVADNKEGGPVTQRALLRALAFADYLESHAKRIYGASDALETGAAKAILSHIRRGDLKDGFTARDIHQRGWSRLTDRTHVQLGLDLLVEFGHLAPKEVAPGVRGGRPTMTYEINPRSLQ